MSVNLSGPLLFFGGPYSNLEALREIRRVSDAKGIPADHVLCSGDVVAYCADPKACVDEIRDWGIHVVMGNCEESLGFGNDDCGCGFEEGTACDVFSKQWFSYASKFLTEDDREWMRSLPRSLDLYYDDIKMTAIHGGVESINRFVFASQDDVLAQECSKTDADIILAGHCGLPFHKQVGEKLWINAGVIGMPANDRAVQTWYCMMNAVQSGVKACFHRLSYDHNKAATKMENVGLAQGYADALRNGLWPSLDVLPDVEKELTGQEIHL